MQVIILAAGRGTRLMHLAQDKPKAMLLINQKPIIGRTMEALLKIPEISDIIVVTGYMSGQINSYIKKEFSSPKIKLIYNGDFEAGNTLTVLKAEKSIKEDFLLLNADHLFSSKAYKKIINEAKDITLGTYDHRKAGYDEMKVRFNSDGSVEMSKTFKKYDCGYLGLTAVSKEYAKDYFDSAKKLVDSYGYNAVVEMLIFPLSKKGIKIHKCNLSNYGFLEIDTQEDYENALRNISLLEQEDSIFNLNV